MSVHAGFPSFLVAAARPPHEGVDRAALARAASEVRDWDEVFRQARAHALVPSLSRALSAAPETPVPAEFKAAVMAAAAQVARANLGSLAPLSRIATTFGERGVQWALYKGPALALWLYGDIGARQFGDLDILVASSSVLAAVDALATLGYAQHGYPGMLNPDDLPSEGQIIFAAPDGGIPFELHWDIAQRYLHVPLSIPALLARAATIDVAGCTLNVLAPNDHVLVLCIHHSKHRWERLQWMSELGEIVGRRAELGVDLELVMSAAEQAGAARMMMLALDLVNELWGIAPPAEIAGRTTRDRELPRLRAEVLGRLASGGGRLSHVGERIAFQSASRERLRDRARLRLMRVFAPSLEDRRAFALPSRLRALYLVLRPMRLAWTRLRRFFSSGNP